MPRCSGCSRSCCSPDNQSETGRAFSSTSVRFSRHGLAPVPVGVLLCYRCDEVAVTRDQVPGGGSPVWFGPEPPVALHKSREGLHCALQEHTLSQSDQAFRIGRKSIVSLNMSAATDAQATVICEVCGTYFETRRGLSSHARLHLRQLGVTLSESSGAPIELLYQLMEESGGSLPKFKADSSTPEPPLRKRSQQESRTPLKSAGQRSL
ncbi:unnamed protein product [Pleuronectes platessa]|uniref:C2H2-type domain-containing protein n=1 Tax=Pleuronectes platessa TaxID=8262 RepID=A0A9N7U8H3_PLEPL|nr:unnamed protein product [Pleuronectes platessa]